MLRYGVGGYHSASSPADYWTRVGFAIVVLGVLLWRVRYMVIASLKMTLGSLKAIFSRPK
jgi:hypothetical protein